jgi:hypothetical protein
MIHVARLNIFILVIFLIKYQFIQLNIIYDWKSFCVQKKKRVEIPIYYFFDTQKIIRMAGGQRWVSHQILEK